MSAISILAGIIQGEANNPADQYGVASTIYNRNNGIGGFSGFGAGQGAYAVATAPGQYSAYPNGMQTPSPYATSLATDLVNGQPPGTSSGTAGTTGNATFYNAAGTNPAYSSGVGNNYGPATNQYSDGFNQPPSSNFQLPQQYNGSSPAPVASDNIPNYGGDYIQNPDGTLTPVTVNNSSQSEDQSAASTNDNTVFANTDGSTQTLDPTANFSNTTQNFGVDLSNAPGLDQTTSPSTDFTNQAGSISGQSAGVYTPPGTVDLSGAGSGLSGLITGGGGGGLGYSAAVQNAGQVPPATTSLDIPNLAAPIAAGFNALGDSIGAAFSNTIASAEAFFGNALVMVLAVVLFLVAAWLMIPRETKTRAVSAVAAAAA